VSHLLVLCSPSAVPSAPSPLSLHDALPIFEAISPLGTGLRRCDEGEVVPVAIVTPAPIRFGMPAAGAQRRRGSNCPSCSPARCEDRKSTRLNSSHVKISYAVFCLKKKTRTQ